MAFPIPTGREMDINGIVVDIDDFNLTVQFADSQPEKGWTSIWLAIHLRNAGFRNPVTLARAYFEWLDIVS